MKVVIGPLGSGKTTELIKMAAEGFYYIVCSHHKEAMNIKQMAKKMELDIPMPITHDEFIRGEFARGRNIKGFLIDNVDHLLGRLANGVEVKGVSFLIGEPKLLSPLNHLLSGNFSSD